MIVYILPTEMFTVVYLYSIYCKIASSEIEDAIVLHRVQ